jgi:FAD/FMN-containing dehydrogenase/ferredoxin
MTRADLPDAARAVAEDLGEDRVLAHPTEVGAVGRDMGEPPALFDRLLARRAPGFVVRPRTEGEVAAAVARLASEGVPITPRGLGSTGLGGAVPVDGGAVLDLSWVTGVASIDPRTPAVEVSAGTSFYHLQSQLQPHGLTLLSRPTNAFGTVGGWASAGGLGLGSLAAGPLADQVLGLRAVHADGRPVVLQREDDGFADLFDTEGQMGILTRLTLRVAPHRARARLVGLVFEDLAAACAYLARVVEAANPRAAILMGRAEELVEGEKPGEILILEADPGDDLPDLDKPGARNLSDAVTSRLWQHRFFPMDSPLGPVFLASEALMPASRVAGFMAAAKGLAGRYKVPLHLHGHVVGGGEDPGVLALLLFPADPRQPWHHLMLTPLAAALTALAVKHEGRPYGVGIWNTPFARDHFGADRVRDLAQRKARWDPRGLLNPGKFFGVGSRAGALSTMMNPGLYPTSLGLASITTPWMMRRHDPSTRPATTADRCVCCGACVPVCPAVAATGNETVSARAKLALIKQLAHGDATDDGDLLGSLRCLKCGQCAEVCARGLDLVTSWEDLEAQVEARLDGPERIRETVEKFTRQVDQSRARVLASALP